MKTIIVSPEKTYYEGHAKSIILPGKNGKFEILENHAPIISSLTKGIIECKEDNEGFSLEINSGFVEVLSNNVHICVET